MAAINHRTAIRFEGDTRVGAYVDYGTFVSRLRLTSSLRVCSNDVQSERLLHCRPAFCLERMARSRPATAHRLAPTRIKSATKTTAIPITIRIRPSETSFDIPGASPSLKSQVHGDRITSPSRSILEHPPEDNKKKDHGCSHDSHPFHIITYGAKLVFRGNKALTGRMRGSSPSRNWSGGRPLNG